MASGDRWQSETDAIPGPAWRGYVDTTLDALILFEACLNGDILHCIRRPCNKEREGLIQSGNVFIYEEHSSGIKRWIDGYNWSPSRILNNFLIYRELEKPLPPRKKALKKNNVTKKGVAKREGSNRSKSAGSNRSKSTGSNTTISAMSTGSDNVAQNSADRALIGSLVDSYPFKEKGLIKKTISVNVNGVPHHLVSYYNIDDVKSGRLVTPNNDPTLKLTAPTPRAQLTRDQNFRVAVEHEEIAFSHDDGSWVHQFQDYQTLPTRSSHMGEADWASQESTVVPSLQPSLSIYTQNQRHIQQQELVSYDPQHQSNYYQFSGHRTAQEYALLTDNFWTSHPIFYASNGPLELLNNKQQNTVRIYQDAWEEQSYLCL